MAARCTTSPVFHHLRVFSVQNFSKRCYFLDSQGGAHRSLFFAGARRDLNSILSRWRNLDRPSHVQRGQVRAFSSDGDEGGEGSEESHEVHAEIEEEEENLTDLIPHPSSSRGGSLSDIAVPDDFPEVPLISLSRHPLFPKFVKLLEVCLILVLCNNAVDTQCGIVQMLCSTRCSLSLFLMALRPKLLHVVIYPSVTNCLS